MTRWTSKEISRLRGRLALTQEKMAQKLGVSFATVNRWEKGRATPTGLSLGILDAAQKEAEKSPAPKKPRKPRKPSKKPAKKAAKATNPKAAPVKAV